MNEYIKKDEILKFKTDVYDADGHVLYAVPTGYIVAMPSVETRPCDKEIKSQAVKEFAERLKNKIKTECNPYGKPTFDYDTSLAIMSYIDNLVKGMVGEE